MLTYDLGLKGWIDLPFLQQIPVNGSKEYMISYIASWTVLRAYTFCVVLLQKLKRGRSENQFELLLRFIR